MASRHLLVADVRRIVPNDWASLQKEHSEWLADFPKNDPIYSIPEEALTVLRQDDSGAAPIIRPERYASEIAFRKFNQSANAVGVWNGRVVSYPALTGWPRRLTRSELTAEGWTAQEQRGYQTALDIADSVCRRLMGVAGWLMTEPEFLQSLRQLRTRTESTGQQRPVFPLRRAFATTLKGDRSNFQDGSNFAGQLGQFLDRWGLMEMTTWDLPSPQGPLFPNGVPVNSPAFPDHGIHVFIPLHYHLQQNDNILRQIEDFQRERVIELGIHPSFAGLPHPEAYAAIFEVLHLENAIRQRLPSEKLRGGHARMIEQAIAAAMGIDVAAVQKHRRAISACRRSKRDSISWLKPRNR